MERVMNWKVRNCILELSREELLSVSGIVSILTKEYPFLLENTAKSMVWGMIVRGELMLTPGRTVRWLVKNPN
jgi:hypothetical protein